MSNNTSMLGRFHVTSGGMLVGMAVPKDDNFNKHGDLNVHHVYELGYDHSTGELKLIDLGPSIYNSETPVGLDRFVVEAKGEHLMPKK